MRGDPNCTMCPLHETAEHVCLMGRGPKHADVMVIGEAPGKREDDIGQPFQGRAGKLLDKLLSVAGFSRDDVYITNAVHCRPPENRTPKKREIDQCKTWLDYEIKRVKPKFVLLLGNVPLQATLGMKGIKKLRGKPIKHDDGIVYYPSYHPSYALHDPRQEKVIATDFRTFKEVIEHGGVPKAKGLNAKLVINQRGLDLVIKDLRRHIAKSWVVSGDTETSGLDIYGEGFKVNTLQIGTKSTQWVIPLDHPESPFKDPQNVVDQLDPYMRKAKIIGHNWKYDYQVMRRRFGVKWKAYFDTMLAQYMCDENESIGLKYLATKFFNAPNYDLDRDEKTVGPLETMGLYGAHDIFYTRKLFFPLKKLLAEDKPTNEIFWRIMMPAQHVFADQVEYYGVYINPKKIQEAHDYWVKKRAEARKELDRLVPSDQRWKNKHTKEFEVGINWGSPQQVATALFDRLGLKPLEYTGTGKYSTNESVLKRLSHKHRVPKLILEWREADKQLNTFVDAWQERLDPHNRLHPTYKLFGTVTGRLSCEQPNLQQVPRDKRVRSLIDAPKGWTFVEADYSQIELRIAADMSGDNAMRMAFLSGEDLHAKTVREILGIPNPDSEQRKKGKAVNFGFIYGMWWPKFVIYCRDNYDLIISDNEAKRYRKNFFRTYNGFPPWHKRMKRFAHMNGYVRSPVGRKRRLPGIHGVSMAYDAMTPEQREMERQAVNSPVQAVPPDLSLASMVEMAEKFPQSEFRIVGQCHDANFYWIKTEKLDYYIPKVKKIMEAPSIICKDLKVRFGIPIKVEIKLGPWGDPYKEVK